MRSDRLWLWTWIGFAIFWTVGLLTRAPLSVRDRWLSPEVYFLVAKTVHVLGYALFAMLTSRQRWRWTLLGLVLLHAPLTEFVQNHVGRTGSLRDVGLDLAGVALGLAVTWRAWKGPARGGEIR